MKRKIIYCLLTALVISTLLLIFTLNFTSLGIDISAMLIYYSYFCLTLSVLLSIFDIAKNKSKTNKYRLLSTTDGLILILSCTFSFFGTIQNIKYISYIIFIFTFILLPVFCSRWNKYSKK